uniref:Tripartite motif-containing protein 2-like n=1 Tax=Saccoglossus kowalevskii TaxID=10224 RepID=A0ABM0MFU1_SACKO|nr:PREDICTED: tripartite motif-containing protein 2-like [Saccoglossus kowalevskii]
METKPPISNNIAEFHPGSDLAAHALMGVIKSDVCPSKCTVENIPKQLLKGESVKLLITTRDSRGKQVIPRQDLTVKSINPDASWEDIDVTDNYNGTFQVMIVEKMVETHQVAITIGNQHIPGSPFNISVPTRGWVQTVGKVATDGKFGYPWGLSNNKHGDFVTADTGKHRVTIHDRDGNYKQSFRFTDQFAKRFSPCDVAISDDNEYYMLDDSNKQVVVSDENGKMIRKFGSSEIDNPCGIAINPVNKNVYVSEYEIDCIREYTQGGVYINSYGKSGREQREFNGPYMLATNSKGLVYVPDHFNHRIQVFNSDDQYMFEFSSTGDSTLSYPKAVAIDKKDYVYVSSDHKVTKHDGYGQFICRIDSEKDRLSDPCGVAVSLDGRIAVVDNNSDCIKVFVE